MLDRCLRVAQAMRACATKPALYRGDFVVRTLTEYGELVLLARRTDCGMATRAAVHALSLVGRELLPFLAEAEQDRDLPRFWRRYKSRRAAFVRCAGIDALHWRANLDAELAALDELSKPHAARLRAWIAELDKGFDSVLLEASLEDHVEQHIAKLAARYDTLPRWLAWPGSSLAVELTKAADFGIDTVSEEARRAISENAACAAFYNDARVFNRELSGELRKAARAVL